MTIYADSLIKADVWATTGIAADSNDWRQLVADHQLSGTMVDTSGQITSIQAGAWRT
ncbi:hypothetical protein [Aerococcus sp. 1KP-2016]|uniref:hypothetical protein n=1 Tax=Aerococcus sp. 1KP-2016 TaxID=1981982 RepID=UPI0013147DE4|nr:hypothetical protein [Aerococcus sp. 1KP-2016]